MDQIDPLPTYRNLRRLRCYRTDLRLTVRVLGQDGHFETHGLCNQIGEGGIGAIIGSELSIGEVVNLNLYLSASKPTSIRAIVRWRTSLQHGFEFFGIKQEQGDEIHEFCKGLIESPLAG